MVKKLVWIILSIIILISLAYGVIQFTGMAVKGCIDSDGGNDPFVKGTIEGFLTAYEDECVNNDVLKERFCNEADLVRTGKYTCRNGCKDGVCVK